MHILSISLWDCFTITDGGQQKTSTAGCANKDRTCSNCAPLSVAREAQKPLLQTLPLQLRLKARGLLWGGLCGLCQSWRMLASSEDVFLRGQGRGHQVTGCDSSGRGTSAKSSVDAGRVFLPTP